MSVKALTGAILADRDYRTNSNHNIIPCFVCGHTFVYRARSGDLNGHFCSIRCQDWHDAGHAPVVEQKVSYRRHDSRPMRMGPKGFYIECAHCQKEFESPGLPNCSSECERSYREREENLAAMAEVGIEPAAKRMCEGPGCTATIPKWRNGRRVSKSARFLQSKMPAKGKEGRGLILSANSCKRCPFYARFFRANFSGRIKYRSNTNPSILRANFGRARSSPFRR